MHETAQEAVREVLAYHHAGKHHLHGYAPGPAFLDWDTQPDPFRRYHDAPLIPLPLVAGSGACTVDALYSAAARAPQALNAHSLGLFLELALGLSAWKSNGVERWALRNNPSSGNLHPTEGYLLLWRAISPELGSELAPGLYHYAPHEHALERRARLPDALAAQLSTTHAGCFGALGLSSVIWREAWKYGARAYRYCQLDVGHALAAARLAARVQGWTLRTETALDDVTLSACLGVDRAEDYMTEAREHADLLAVLGTATPQAAIDWPTIARALETWTGTANRLSQELVEWPQITRLLPALHKPVHDAFPPAEASFSGQTSPDDNVVDEPMDACTLIRQRRSAQRMDVQSGVTRRTFERMLRRTLPRAGCAPFDALLAPPAIQLLLFVHAVEGLEPGIYVLIRATDSFDALRQACRSDALAWQPVPDTSLPLYRLYAPLELRKHAAQLSCQQGIAGRGAFSLGMLADLGGALEKEGAWVYRRLFWEAGMIGQVLYLEAESAGMQGTGIGCFFDDEVHRLLGLEAEGDWQDLYHFTVGKGLSDTRLASEPAYAHLPAQRLCLKSST